jgi:predicted metal-dependent enzyme (double-stranded beta helix superfamily)
MFDVDTFIAECRDANAAQGSPAVREVVARAVASPADVIRAVGEPARAGVQVLHRSPELTILNLVWGPKMCQVPHDHAMWAVLGIYTGREDNIFWRRLPGAAGGRIEAAGAKAVSEREAVPLGRDIVHSVVNPIRRLTGAIHVYGGDFFAVPRSEWDPEHLVEQPYDIAKTLALFEESNRLYPPA